MKGLHKNGVNHLTTRDYATAVGISVTGIEMKTRDEIELENNPCRRRKGISPVILLSVVGVLLTLSVSSVENFWPSFRMNHAALHAVFETLGCMLALGIAGFLLMCRSEGDKWHTVWLACSILVMGIIDAFHASMMPCNEFVCLRSVSQLAGGVCVALIWLPERVTQTKLVQMLPKILAAAAGLFGAMAFVYPEILPPVLVRGEFTQIAARLNFVGGILFLGGVAYFFSRFDRTLDTIDILFAVYCLLFGVAGVTFVFSTLWGPSWWLLHLVRLAAYVVAFKYVSANSAAQYAALVASEESLRKAKAQAENAKTEVEKVNRRLEASARQANKLARDAIVASEAKSEFLANMSHELRTPLHSILSFASFGIKKHADAERQKLLDYFTRISKSGTTLLALLNDLLDLAKLESRKVVFSFEPADINELLESVADEMCTLLSEKDLTVTYELSDLGGQVVLDPDKIKQVLRNFLNNAIKFSPEGGVIEIASSRTDVTAKISVSDCGPGIPEDELEAVFDKFVQSSKTKTGAGGTGLGLSISYAIIAAHRGRIWAENRSEGGATFSFEIPLTQPEGTCDQPLPKCAGAGTST